MAKNLDENYKIGLDIDGDGKPDFGLSLKTIGAVIFAIISLAGVWFSLKADIALAMEMPEPTISKTEWELKDELIRNTIMDTQDDVEMILEKLDKLDERIYEIQKNR
jgi:peptidoglycan hydrolase CwlO-like protein